MTRIFIIGLTILGLITLPGCGPSEDADPPTNQPSTGDAADDATDDAVSSNATPTPTTEPDGISRDPNPRAVPPVRPGAAPPVVTTITPPPAPTGDEVLSLIDAAGKGDIEAMRAAMARGESVNRGDNKFNVRPLMKAAQSGCIACMDLLLENGADLEARNTADATALIMAAQAAPVRSVQWLLAKGADVTATTPSGYTALKQANMFRLDTDLDKALIIVLLEQAEAIGR